MLLQVNHLSEVISVPPKMLSQLCQQEFKKFSHNKAAALLSNHEISHNFQFVLFLFNNQDQLIRS